MTNRLATKVLSMSMVVALAAPAIAQHTALDPVVSLPKNYQVQFENEWVRVVRVRYDAKAQLPEHEHPAGLTMYVYLNASDGVLFTHDDKTAPLPRPPVVPGGIRVAVSRLEHHTVTNNAATPSDFIRILLKTDVNNRINRPITRMSPATMAYDHPSVHVERVDVQPGTSARIDASKYPVFRIACTPGKDEWKIDRDGYRFLEKGTVEDYVVAGKEPMQLITIELRTAQWKR